MHVALTLEPNAFRVLRGRTGGGVFLPIITQCLLKFSRIGTFVFPTSLCGKIAFFVLRSCESQGIHVMAMNEAAQRPLS
jgi:hypothetical protein